MKARILILKLLLAVNVISLARMAFASSCTPTFPLQRGSTVGWQGADAAYSVPLPDGRDVWIFGDTLYGPQRSVTGNEPRMVHNSLGVSTCDASGRWGISYIIRRNRSGRPDNYFTPANPQHWYWAMDGFTAHGDLYVTLLCLRASSGPVAGGLGFETCGSDLAHVSNLAGDPHHWTISISPLVPDGAKAYPSASAVLSGDYAYLFALYEHGSRPLLVTRIPLNGLDKPQDHLQYLDKQGVWQPGFQPEDAKEIMQAGSTELSIRFHKKQHQWLALLMDPASTSGDILVRTAPDLLGPWTPGQRVYSPPEMKPVAANKDTFCYAAKEHPELEDNGNILFTYACNTHDVPSLATNYSIYFPRVVTIPIP